MPLSMYGNTNPKGLEPFQIQSTLAPLAVGNSRAEAQNMLDTYQAQRNAATNLYGQDLQQQHQAFYDQLAGQMQQNYIKEFANVAKLPGGAQFVASGGIPGMSAAMGGNPDAIAGLAQAGSIADASKNFGETGKGYEGFSNAGLLINPQQVPGLAGVQGNLTENARVAAERIRANAMLGAASIPCCSAVAVSNQGSQCRMSQTSLAQRAQSVSQRVGQTTNSITI